jgi:membrane protein required for colicin V production
VKATGEAIRSVLLQVIPQQPSTTTTPPPATEPPAGQQGFLDQKGRSVALVIKDKRYYMTVA